MVLLAVLSVLAGLGYFGWRRSVQRAAERQQAQREAAIGQLAAIGDDEKQRQLRKLHLEIFDLCMQAAEQSDMSRVAEVEPVFASMRGVAGGMQGTELVKLGDVHRHYAQDPDRWGLVCGIPSVRANEHPAQPLCPASWPSEDGRTLEPLLLQGDVEAASRSYCRFQAAMAAWTLPTLKDVVERLAKDFNSLAANEIVDKYELPDLLRSHELDPNKYYLVEDAKNDVQGGVACVRVGPLKQAARAEAKVRSLREELGGELATGAVAEPLARYVLDFMRATVCFEDPFAMRLFFEALQRVCRVVRVKNKYDAAGPTAESGNPSILINVGIKTPYGECIGEVQLILQAYLVAKQVQHKSYEAMRASSVWELLRGPLYKKPWPEEQR